MTYRPSDSSSRDCYSQPQSRLNQQIRCDSTDEGCPVFEESGTVCGETGSLGVFQEFRQIYDNCLKKLEGTPDGSATLRKLAPFKKIIDDLWEQNTMLVETVEELEQEATCKVTNLQDKLNKSCQKVFEYKEDIKSLTEVIRRYCEKGVFDTTGLKFNTLSPECAFSNCAKIESCPSTNFVEVKAESQSLLRSKSNHPEEETIKLFFAPPKNPKGNQKFNSCNTPSRSKLPSTKARNANGPQNRTTDSLAPSLCPKICTDSSCYYKNVDQSALISDPKPEGKDGKDCKRAINVNLNLGKDSFIREADCCCCSCPINLNEAEDC